MIFRDAFVVDDVPSRSFFGICALVDFCNKACTSFSGHMLERPYREPQSSKQPRPLKPFRKNGKPLTQ